MTHEVFNQPEPLVDVNLFDGHRAMQDALRFNAPGLDTAPLQALGQQVGSAQMQQHARLAHHAASSAEGDSDADDGEDAAEHDDDYNALSADDAADPQNSRSREEASSNWLADAGFDRKE